MIRLLAATLFLSAAGCATLPADDVGPGPARERCDASGLQSLVGRTATVELGAEAMRRSGARSLRWIQPGDAVTMDYRFDRLNVHLDDRNRVERFTCG